MSGNLLFTKLLIILSISIVALSTSTTKDLIDNNNYYLPSTIKIPADRQLKGEVAILCPQESMIPPCTCEPYPIYHLYCDGPLVTRDTILSLTQAVRQVNGFSPDTSLNIAYLHITNTTLTHLNLDDLESGDVKEISFLDLDISSNPQLKTITAGSLVIDTYVLTMANNGFDDLELSTGLSGVFQSTAGSVRTLYLDGNLLTGLPINGNNSTIFDTIHSYYPDLSAFSLARNKLLKLSGGQFELFDHLSILSLQQNEIVELGDDALKFLNHWPHPDGLRQIFLEKNNLTDAKISPLAFTGLNGPTRLVLDYNQFEFISAQHFEQLLLTPPENPSYRPKIELKNNTFICDERMRWLHDQSAIFQNIALGIECVNDPGKDIFTTDLLD